jgi:hypothetical protein
LPHWKRSAFPMINTKTKAVDGTCARMRHQAKPA